MRYATVFLAAAFLTMPHVSGDQPKGLAVYYRDYFPIGVAVSVRSITGPDTALILREFNSLTPENAMKMGPIHPEEGRYNWKDADAIVDFATAHGMRIRGHNLCWHEQTPGWLFKNSAGDTVTKEALLKRLKDHITAVVSRYKGRIYAWDVVNEAVADEAAMIRPGSFATPPGSASAATNSSPKPSNMPTLPTPMPSCSTTTTTPNGRRNGNGYIVSFESS